MNAEGPPMRILHLITTVDVGGAEMHLLSQVRGQSELGHEVRVRFLKGEGRLTRDFLDAGAQSVERVGWRGLGADVRWAAIVHTHLLKADGVGALVATLLGRRGGLVASKHNDERALLSPVFGRVHGVLGRLPRRTIPLSDHVAAFTAEHGRIPLERQTRIHYGIDPQRFRDACAAPAPERAELRASLGAAPEDFVFICVARFAPQKAHDVLVQAFDSAAGRSERRLVLWLVGDDPGGDGRTRIEALAAQLPHGDRVHFTGIRRDVPHLMAASDAFVMSSLWEGLGLVFLEAMACELPVVSSRVSAIPEVVLEGETGLLVPPGDTAPLAEALVTVSGDPELARRLGSAGLQRVLEEFAIRRMILSTLDVYRDLLGSRK